MDTLEPFNNLRRSMTARLSDLRKNLTIMLRGFLGFRPLTPTRWATSISVSSSNLLYRRSDTNSNVFSGLAPKLFFWHTVYPNRVPPCILFYVIAFQFYVVYIVASCKNILFIIVNPCFVIVYNFICLCFVRPDGFIHFFNFCVHFMFNIKHTRFKPVQNAP